MSISTPLISIIIPTYNHAHFLQAALDSVCAQTFSDWEAIVVNNFSQDDTIAIVDSYGDARIRLVNFANYGIIASSRNYGLSLTQAPFLAFLDSDDSWYPEKLQRCLNKLNEGYDLVCHAETWVGPSTQRRVVCYGPENKAKYESLLFEGNCLSTSAVMVRRECVDRVGFFSVEQEFVTAEDYELWLKLARCGAKFGFIEDVLGKYLIHNSNQSRAALQNMKAVMAVYERHCKQLAYPQPLRRRRRREALILYGGARTLQNNFQNCEFWRILFKAIRCYPWIPRIYVAMLLRLIGWRY